MSLLFAPPEINEKSINSLRIREGLEENSKIALKLKGPGRSKLDKHVDDDRN
jgi:hypothetical protein